MRAALIQAIEAQGYDYIEPRNDFLRRCARDSVNPMFRVRVADSAQLEDMIITLLDNLLRQYLIQEKSVLFFNVSDSLMDDSMFDITFGY